MHAYIFTRACPDKYMYNLDSIRSYYQHTTPAKSDKKPRASKAVLQGRNVEATKMKVAKTDSNSKRGVKEEEDNGSSSSLSSSSFHTPQKNRRITATNRDKDSRGIHKNNKSPSASSSLSSLPSSSTSSLILSPSEVDLLFMKSMKIKGRRGREQAYGNSQSRLMDFPQFCRAIMRLATLAHSAMTPIDAIQLLLMNAQTRFYTTIDSHV